MPKKISEEERAYIKERLIEEARKCLIQYGVRKTTVDELVKRVDIPKGTFYLFYSSKELLLFDVLKEFHDEIQEQLLSQVNNVEESITPNQLTDIFFDLYRSVEASFLLPLMTNGEMEYLIRKLPKELASMHAIKDDLQVEQLVSLVPNMRAEKIKTFSAALRAIFLSMLHKHEIGDSVFEDALKIMIHGVVVQMFEEVEDR